MFTAAVALQLKIKQLYDNNTIKLPLVFSYTFHEPSFDFSTRFMSHLSRIMHVLLKALQTMVPKSGSSNVQGVCMKVNDGGLTSFFAVLNNSVKMKRHSLKQDTLRFYCFLKNFA